MKEEFAKRLKEKRNKLGLSIEEVVEETKLHPSVIKALEEGRWEEINPTYLKGFLKIYCSFLGEEYKEELLKSFSEGKEPSSSSRVKKTAPPPGKVFVKETISKITLKPVLILLLSGGFIFALFFLGNIVRERLFKTRPALSSRKPSIEEKRTITTPPGEEKKIYVTITARKDCFIRTKVDGRVVFEGILKKGAVESWEAKEAIEFKINDGTAVDVEVNGKLLPPLTKLHKPIKSLKITPTEISVIK